jgi:hypothetical protein
MNKKEIIELLKELQSKNPDKTITRDFFRKTTDLFDSTWQQYFGSWLEFRAEAGLEQSRGQRKLYAAITKHASVDKLRDLNALKTQWEGKYLKPDNNRLQTILCGSDFHDILCDPFHLEIFIDTAKRVQPNKILLNGDILDMYEFSKYTKDPRKVDIVAAIKWAHVLLERLREACPDAEIIWTEGNHENRLVKMLAETNPNLMPILSDLHGMTVGSLLGLDKFEVNYVTRSDLATFNESDNKKEIAKNYYIAYDTVLFHHFPFGKKFGLAGTNGHHHSHRSETHFNALTGPYEWHQTGAGHIRRASYCEGERWSNGFLIIHVDTQKKLSQFNYIDTTHDFVEVGGKFYQRNEDQIIKLKA